MITTKKITKKSGEEKKKVAKVKKEKLSKIVRKKKEEKPVEKPRIVAKPERYFEAVGRRKTSIARVRLFTKGEKQILINDKPYNVYFPTIELQQTVIASLEKMNCMDRFFITAQVRGGGLHSQAEAVRHGIARALVIFNLDFKKRLRKAGYLTRDPRMRERKKFGLKRARRAPQWQKR